MSSSERPLALVTGASSGIGQQLAIQCAEHGLDLVVVAESALDDTIVCKLRGCVESVEFVHADLGTTAGVDQVYAALHGRSVDALLADGAVTNVAGTARLVHKVARDMVAEGVGRILIAGSIAGIDWFTLALRTELQDSGVTVTCLTPQDSDLFADAEVRAAEVARIAYEAMIEGEFTPAGRR